MSSSAFTPTKTEITTEVPVNVPVVEAWQSYNLTIGATITAPTAGTILVNEARWRRVGDSMEIYYSLRTSTNGTVGSGIYLFPLPAGYTADSSKMSPAGTGSSGAISIVGPAEVERSSIVYTGAAFLYNSNSIAIQVGANGQATSLIGTLFTLDLPVKYTFRATVPIAEWASSGTTTLATRAVEEYAYNTDTTNASNPSAFANGPDGVLFPAITATGLAVLKRVRFPTAIQSTDTIILEYQQQSAGPWRAVSQRFPLTAQGSGVYGIELRNVAGSNTDIDVSFRESGAVSSGATYGLAGELWNAYRLDNWKWRVRKVSSGAQVGYPVSARNIVGDTSGSVVPVGMLGEVRTVTGSGTLQVNPSTYGDIAGMSLQLGPGTWMLTLKAAAYIKHNAAGNQINTVNLILTDSSNAVIANSPVQAQVENQPQTSGTAMQFVWNLTSTTVWTNTTTQSIKMRGLRSNLTGGIELLNDSDARITAIIATRIA